MPEGSSQYVYLQSKRWRAIGYNWDILSNYDNTSRLYCLTDFQAAWLLSNTEYMRWSSRWQNCPCTQADLDAMKAEMEFNLMSCVDFQPWQLQALYEDAQQAEINQYKADFDGDPSSVNPSAPDDFFNGDGSSDRDDALCTALTLWTYSYAVDWSTKASLVLGVAYAGAAIATALTGVGGIIAVVALADLLAPLQDQINALNNITALDTVICDWNTALQGTAISASNWNAAVSGLSYTPGSDEDIIQQLFAFDTDDLGNFLSFVNALGNGYDLAQRGIFICPCNDAWSSILDFTTSDYGVVFQLDDSSNPIGEWVNGVGLKPTNAVVGGVNRRQIAASINFDDSTVTSQIMQGSYTRGTNTGGFSVALIEAMRFGGSVVSGTSESQPFSSFSVGVPTLMLVNSDGYSVTADRADMTAACSYINFSGDATIETLTITGIGIKPPQLP